VEPVDLLYAGFSCTSLSDNNGQRQTFREAFAAGNFKKAGESGKTFSALMEFLGNAPEKPQAITLENVRGINKGPLGIRPLDVSAYFLLMTC
jgi:site-specific DNA-cytosine methylase